MASLIVSNVPPVNITIYWYILYVFNCTGWFCWLFPEPREPDCSYAECCHDVAPLAIQWQSRPDPQSHPPDHCRGKVQDCWSWRKGINIRIHKCCLRSHLRIRCSFFLLIVFICLILSHIERSFSFKRLTGSTSNQVGRLTWFQTVK